MNDTARLAAHRELETEGSTTPAQSRSLPRSAAMDPARFCTAPSQSRAPGPFRPVGIRDAAAQRARELSMPDDHARPWTFHCTAGGGGYHVVDAHGLLVATGLSRRDAKLIAGAPELAALAHQFCEDVDGALTRVGL